MVERDNFLNETILLHESSVWIQFLFVSAAISERRQLWRQSPFVPTKWTMAVVEVQEYNALPLLPSGSTISLWNNRTKVYNVPDNELNQRIVLPDNCQQSWASLFDNDKMYWFTVMTKEEYNTIVVDGIPQFLPSNLREKCGWEQLVFLPTVEEAVCFAAYHMSQRHMSATMETMVIGFEPQAVNLAYNVGQKKVNHFQRGQSVQFLQVLSPYKYILSNVEKDNLRVMSMDYNPANKFVTYNWNKDFLWYYGHTLHITTLLKQWKSYNDDEKNNDVHNTIMCMCLDHLGLEGTSHLTMEAQDSVQQFRIHNRLDTSFVDRPLQAQCGHEDHKKWIEDNSILKDKKDDDDKDEDNEDDNNEENKKRRVDTWDDDSCQQWIQLWQGEQCSAICQWDSRHQQYCTTSRTMKICCNNEGSWNNARTFLYRLQLRLQQSREKNNWLWSDFTLQLDLTMMFFSTIICLDFQSVWDNAVPNNLRDGVKIQVYIQYMWYLVYTTVYNVDHCRALGSSLLRDNCPEYKRCWVTYNTTCTSRVDFYISIYPSVLLSAIHLSICPSIHLSIL